jgi:DNA-directed RNA polymerase subunit L
MELKFVEKKKGVVELEFDEKELPVALTGALLKNGVDAYWYEPHPLLGKVRLHIDADDAQSELKKAVSALDSEWGQFRKAVEAKLK